MALKTWTHDTKVRRTGSTSTSWGRFELPWSGLPKNIRIKRIYWQWDVSRQNGNVYARWYYGTTGDTISGSTGMNGTAFQFDVTSKVTISGTSGTAWVYLGAQYGWADYSNISFNIEFDYLQSSFTLSTTNVNAGAAITANIAIQDATATHRLTWQFGTRTIVVTTGAGVATSSFTPPLAWLDQIPSAVSGLASCTLETINSAGTVVGSQVLYFNILAPASVVPTISAFTATRVNNSVPSAWGVYVQGQSGVTVKATAAGAYGSTITGYTLTGDGKTANAATLSIAKLSGSGTLTFKATVVDSRGRSASKTLTISVVAWSSPTIKTLSVVRCNADGSANPAGSSILVNLTGAIASVSSKNTASVTVKYRAQSATTWLSGATGTAASGSWVIAADAALPTNAYEVQAVLADAFASATQAALLPTAECYIDKMPGRKRLGIGGYNATDKTVYINPEWGIHWGEKHITDRPCNLLDNSWWGQRSEIVNQRGVTTGWTTGYGIDRWRMLASAGSTSIDVTTDGLAITNTGTSSVAYIQQNLDDALFNKLAGNPVTAAICLSDGTIVAGSKVCAVGMELQVKFTGGDIRLRKPSNGTFMCRVVNTVLNSTITVKWVAVYEGAYTADTLPEYVPKGYATELVECQRYYVRFQAASDAQFIPGGSNGNNLYATLQVPVAMRLASPTLSFENINIYPYIVGAAYDITSLEIVGTAATGNFVALRASHGNDSMAAGALGCIRILKGGYIALSADL